MKKLLFAVTISLLFVAGPLMSQKQFYFGIGGGGLSSIITNQNNYGLTFEMDYDITFGGAGNVNVGFDFNKNIGLKLEIGFAKLGQKYSDIVTDINGVDNNYTRNIKLNYLQIPILFKYRANGEVVRFYAMAGPQLNYLLSASQKYLKNEVTWDDEVPGDWTEPTVIGESTITDRYNSLDVMLRIDAGVDIIFTENLFMNVGITTAYGLMDINATDWQNPFNNKDYTYNPSHNLYGGINIGINYTLPIGSK